MIKKVTQFFSDVNFEIKKVTWPTWDELKGSTIVVLVLSLVLAFFLFVVDLILSKVLNILL